MAPKKAIEVSSAAIDADEPMPAWKRQSVDRSLAVARARATERSDRFVRVTLDLIASRGNLDFTVQDVIERSHMSIRTFYKFFESKDDLLVAVHETVLVDELAPRLRERIDATEGPILRLRAYVEAMVELTAEVGSLSRALTTFRNRLAETRPDELERAFKPLLDLVGELVAGIAATGDLRSDLPPPVAARLLHYTVLSVVHAHILGGEPDEEITASQLWTYCALGIGIDRAALSG